METVLRRSETGTSLDQSGCEHVLIQANGRVKIYQSMDGWIHGRMRTLVYRYQLTMGIGHRPEAIRISDILLL